MGVSTKNISLCVDSWGTYKKCEPEKEPMGTTIWPGWGKHESLPQMWVPRSLGFILLSQNKLLMALGAFYKSWILIADDGEQCFLEVKVLYNVEPIVTLSWESCLGLDISSRELPGRAYLNRCPGHKITILMGLWYFTVRSWSPRREREDMGHPCSLGSSLGYSLLYVNDYRLSWLIGRVPGTSINCNSRSDHQLWHQDTQLTPKKCFPEPGTYLLSWLLLQHLLGVQWQIFQNYFVLCICYKSR